MKKNRIGKSDLYTSSLTLGCMSLGTNVNEAQRIIDASIDYGINHLDTADLYDFGKNEELIGEAIKHRRKELILTTKVGNHFDKRAKTHFWDPSPAYIEKAVLDSLRRLQTDYIDLYLLHGGTIEDDKDATIEAFERLKQKGVIRAYGISSIRPNVINYYRQHANIDAVMMQYSMLDRRPESLFSLLKEYKISILARGPLAKGILSPAFAQNIPSKASNGYIDYDLQSLRQTIKTIQSPDIPLHHLALQYVLHEPIVASAVFGASSVKQVVDNAQSLQLDGLTDRQYNHLQHLLKQTSYINHTI